MPAIAERIQLTKAHGATDAIHVSGASYPLPGYARRTLGGVELVARTEFLDCFCEVVTGHGTLYSWARNQPQPQALRGRAPVYVAQLSDATATSVVIRHSWHGGIFAALTSDRFLRPTRAPIELLRSYMLAECHIPTPEVVGFALYRAGPLMARVDVATRYVPNAHDLSAVLAGHVREISRQQAFAAVEQLLVQLASFGFTHSDLNVKNVLLHYEQAVLVAAVLDVDVMLWNTSESPADIMLANVARLARSMRKSRAQFGVSLTDSELSTFVERMLGAAPTVSRIPRDSATFSSRNVL